MLDVLGFWAAAIVIAACGFPIAAVVLRRLPDAGAGLSFPLGLLVTSYLYFILRVLHVLSAGRRDYFVAVVIVALIAAAIVGRDRWFKVTWRRAWPGVVIAVAVFSFAFFGYTAFRSYNSEIGGTEQPMDLMYLNATLTSADYPPKDPWLAGESASYYYFGYLQSGVLTSVSGVPASTGYNLSLAYTFAAAAAGIASLAYALARWVMGSRARNAAFAAGGLAVVLLLFVGSLSAVFEWSAAHEHYNEGLYKTFGVEWMLPCKQGVTENCYTGAVNPRTTEWYPTQYWFWWQGSRVIPNTITEFPFFSFLLGDLHPHVMSLPLVLLAIGAAAAVWRGRRTLDWRRHLRMPQESLLFAVLLGGLFFLCAKLGFEYMPKWTGYFLSFDPALSHHRGEVDPAAAKFGGLLQFVEGYGGKRPGKWFDYPFAVSPHMPLWWGIYYCGTAIHALHVVIGMTLIARAWWRAGKGCYGPTHYTYVECTGLYWHLVDLVWIFLFPLLYLIH